MFRLIIALIIGFSFNNVWANCDVTSKFNINVNVLPIKYDYSKTSNEIKRIPNIQKNNDSQYLLGAYVPLLSVGLNYQSMRESSYLKICNKVVSMNVTLKLDSTIFIAKEIQPFSCTLNRTLDHEMHHFNFQKESLEVGVDYLKRNLEPIFSKKIYSSANEYDKYMKQQLDILQKNTLNLIDNYASKKHALIDNIENYKKESLLCSFAEQEIVSKSILSTY